MEKYLKLRDISKYEKKLYEEEKSKLTVEKYIRDILHFYNFLPHENGSARRRQLPINSI